MRLLILILALAMMLSSLWQNPAKAQNSAPNVAPAPAGEFNFIVCNNYSTNIWFAFISHVSPSDSRFHVEGWWKADVGCTFLRYFPQGNFYFFAFSEDFKWQWSGTMFQCVELDKAFDRLSQGDVQCDSSSLKGFIEVTIPTTSGQWIITLS